MKCKQRKTVTYEQTNTGKHVGVGIAIVTNDNLLSLTQKNW